MQKGPGRCHSSFPGSLRPQPKVQAAPNKESSPSRYSAPYPLPTWYTTYTSAGTLHISPFFGLLTLSSQTFTNIVISLSP